MKRDEKYKTSIVRIVIIALATLIALGVILFIGFELILGNMFDGWRMMEAVNEN